MDQVELEARKTLCIIQLTNDLPVLRAALGLSQEELAERVGLSRQTYNALETKTRVMTWATCMALIGVFANNDRTRKILQTTGFSLQLFNEIVSI